jgi:carbonic anhydrase/acetyltransferase-like protein (isoleucine patch superfamily)
MATYIPYVTLNSADFIQTSAGNIIHKNVKMLNPTAIEISGGKCVLMDNTVLHSDVAPIKLDKYCIVNEGCILKPCKFIDIEATEVQAPKYISLSVGSYSFIGKNTVVECAVIGLGCRIGSNCTISARSVLKDHVHVEDNTVVPMDMVIPPFAVVAGNPGKIVGFVCESASTTARTVAMTRYKSFILEGKDK